MSRTIGYLRRNAKVQQRNEFTAGKDESNALVCNYVFYCRDNDALYLTPDAGEACPRYGYTHLEAVSSDITALPNQPYSRVETTYTGSDSTDDGGGDYTFGDKDKIYTTTYSAASDPIESHRKFKNLSEEDLRFASDWKAGNVKIEGTGETKKYYVLRKNAAAVEFKKEYAVDSLLAKLLEYLGKGVTVYFSPRVDFSMSWVSGSSSTSGGTIGRIDTPPSAAPSLQTGADWLYIGGESRKKGGVYAHRKTWKSSGSGGWDEDLYV